MSVFGVSCRCLCCWFGGARVFKSEYCLLPLLAVAGAMCCRCPTVLDFFSFRILRVVFSCVSGAMCC